MQEKVLKLEVYFFQYKAYNNLYMRKLKKGRPRTLSVRMKGCTLRKGMENMKASSMNTHMGSISIDSEVIAQYAGAVAMECFGIVGMANVSVKDGLVNLLKMDNMTKGINVVVNPNHKLVLDFHVIVSYGVSISAVADNLIDNVKYKVEEFTGLEIEKINIYVEGVRVID